MILVVYIGDACFDLSFICFYYFVSPHPWLVWKYASGQPALLRHGSYACHHSYCLSSARTRAKKPVTPRLAFASMTTSLLQSWHRQIFRNILLFLFLF